jgi:predicted RNase H-like HicB family nuclease
MESLMMIEAEQESKMEYRIILIESEEGFAVSCPALRGCHSQGATREEALENIKIAIREWLDAEAEEAETFSVTEEFVRV